jgi:hypothetical protein
MANSIFLRIALFIFALLLISIPAISSDIFLKKEGGIYRLPVKINRVIILDFILDSGASEVCIPADVAMTLLRAHTIEKTDFLPGKSYTLADGSVLRSERFIIRELEIDSIKISNVPAMISPIRGDLLLGQSFLQRLDSWAIDNKRHALVVDNSTRNENEQSKQNIPNNQKEIPAIEDGTTPIIHSKQLMTLPRRWAVDWTSLFHYKGQLTIQRQLEKNQYQGKLVVNYHNKIGKSLTASQDALITITGNKVVMQCTNPSLQGWDTDTFYLEISDNKMVGYSEDTRGRRGTAVFTVIKESSTVE